MSEPKLTEAQRAWGVPLNDDDTTGVLWFHEPVVARMVAEAEQTARAEGRAEGWDEGNDAGYDDPRIRNPYRSTP